MHLVGFIAIAIALAASCQGQGRIATASLVRTYPGKWAALLDLSADGQRVLVRDRKLLPCVGDKGYCQEHTLAVYRTDTGALISQVSTGADGWIRAARFTNETKVEFFQSTFNWRKQWISWSPTSGQQDLLWQGPVNLEPYCVLPEGRLLGVDREGRVGRSLSAMVVVERDGKTHTLRQPEIADLGIEGFACEGWRIGNSYLLEGTEGPGNVRQNRLYRVSLDPEVPYTVCFTPNSVTHGHAVSPDGRVIAVITSTGDSPDPGLMGPDQQVYLNLLDGSTCHAKQRVELQFPEKPRLTQPLLAPKNKYLANARFGGDWSVAISPDGSKLALGYGVRTNGLYSDVHAYFALYSLPDGRRLATLKADIQKSLFWEAIRGADLRETPVPMSGALLFSPDSRNLYASSRRVWQWDI